jgi:hypothetical protein
MLMTMRTSLMTMEKTRTRLDDNRRSAGLEQMITRQLGGAMLVWGDCATSSSAVTPFASFNGTPQTLHFVSSYSMTEGTRGYPRFLEYQVVPDEGGTVKLVVNEHLYSGPAATAPFCFNYAFLPVKFGPDSFVIADHLAYCRISYQERNQQTTLGGKWMEVWNRPDLPTAIRIEMSPAVPNPRSLAALAVTVSLHITRKPDVTYDDQ